MVRETMLSIYRTASARDVSLLAAGFAYYAFVSIIPLIMLALVIGSVIGGERLAARLIEVAGDMLPAAGDELVTNILTTEAGRVEATAVALLVGLWGGLKVFRGLSNAFDIIYNTEERDSLVDQIKQGIGVLVAIIVALSLMIAAGVVLGIVAGEIPFAWVLSWIVLLFGLVIAFLPMYYLLPPIPVSLGEIIPGAIVAAIGWTLLQVGFQFYAANAGQYEAYGAIGAILLFVTWLYFAGMLILFGAVVNVVRSRPDLAA